MFNLFHKAKLKMTYLSIFHFISELLVPSYLLESFKSRYDDSFRLTGSNGDVRQ